MMEGREDSGSSFLEPQISIASTLSIGADIRETEGDSLNPRTFVDDADACSSDSEEEQECRHDQRADLQKMMSRRNFAVVDGGGLRHRVRSSSGLEPPAVRPEVHGGSMGGGGHHGRRRSSMTVVPETNELPPGDQRQSHQVCMHVCVRECGDSESHEAWGVVEKTLGLVGSLGLSAARFEMSVGRGNFRQVDGCALRVAHKPGRCNDRTGANVQSAKARGLLLFHFKIHASCDLAQLLAGAGLGWAGFG